MLLERDPLIVRRVEDGRRELMISNGRDTCLALYRGIPAPAASTPIADDGQPSGLETAPGRSRTLDRTRALPRSPHIPR